MSKPCAVALYCKALGDSLWPIMHFQEVPYQLLSCKVSRPSPLGNLQRWTPFFWFLGELPLPDSLGKHL